MGVVDQSTDRDAGHEEYYKKKETEFAQKQTVRH